MSDDLASIRIALAERSTEDLVSILQQRNDEEWRPEVFEIVRSILAGRRIFAGDAARLWQEMTERKNVVEERTPEGPMGVPPEGYTQVARGLGLLDAEKVGEELGHEGMPFFLDARHGRHSTDVYVPLEHEWIARVILEKGGFIPPQPPETDAPVGAAGGNCPACGAKVPAGGVECPGCGLALG